MTGIQDIKIQFEADTKGDFDVEQVKNKFLSRKRGLITQAFEQLADLDLESKKKIGRELNELKIEVEAKIASPGGKRRPQAGSLDVTLPPLNNFRGRLHPITQTEKQLEDIFKSIGFGVRPLPEIETDWYNFEALNMPKFHPARDTQDTFYVNKASLANPPKEEVVLRTHISTVQSRTLETCQPPFAQISYGRVYRNEATDASHEHTYNEIEGIVVGKDVRFSSMVWTLDFVLKKFFGGEIKTRLVPSYFPFTEPSAEMAISCLNCMGKGCPVCKKTGWVELLGCGMTHQNVYANLGYKKGELQGFAFGMGTSRLALMKYKIPDIRLFNENNLQFLNQF